MAADQSIYEASDAVVWAIPAKRITWSRVDRGPEADRLICRRGPNVSVLSSMDLFAVADGAGRERASLFFSFAERIYCVSLTSPGDPAAICFHPFPFGLARRSVWDLARDGGNDVTIRRCRRRRRPSRWQPTPKPQRFHFGAGDHLPRLVSSHLFRLPFGAADLFLRFFPTIKEKSAAAAVVRTNNIGAHLHAAIVFSVCSPPFTFRSRTKSAAPAVDRRLINETYGGASPENEEKKWCAPFFFIDQQPPLRWGQV